MQTTRRYSLTFLIFGSYFILAEAFLQRSLKTAGVSQTQIRNGAASNSLDEDEDNMEDVRDGDTWKSQDEDIEKDDNDSIKLLSTRDKSNVDSVERNRRSAQSEDIDQENIQIENLTSSDNIVHEEGRTISTTPTQKVSNEANNEGSNKSRNFSPSEERSKDESHIAAEMHSVVDILGDRDEDDDGDETSTKSNNARDKHPKRVMYGLDDLYREFMRRWLLRMPEDTTTHATGDHTTKQATGDHTTTDSTIDTALQNNTFGDNTLQNITFNANASQNTPFSANAPQDTPFSANASQNTTFSANASQNTPFSANAPQDTPFSANDSQKTTFSANASQNTPVSANASQNTPVSATAPQDTPFSANATQDTTLSVGVDSTGAAISVKSTRPTSNDSAANEQHVEEANKPTTFNANAENENRSVPLLEAPQSPWLNASLLSATQEKHQHGKDKKVQEFHKSQTENEQNINEDETIKEQPEFEWSMDTESNHSDWQHEINDTGHAFRDKVWKIAVVNISEIKPEGNSSTLKKQATTTMEIVENLAAEDDNDNINVAGCPTCVEREKNVKLLRLKLFKNLLIQKLRLDPRDTHRNHTFDESRVPKLPDAMVERTLKDNAREIEKDEFHARDQELIISGEDMGRDCVKLQATGCYSFNLKARIKGEVAQAELWTYKMKDPNDGNGQTFNLYELERLKSGRLAHSSMIVSAENTVEEGWVVLNVTRSVRKWADKRKVSEMLAVRCVSCATRSHKALYGAKLDYKPLLVIKYDTNDNHVSRQKRSQSCDPRSECCKRDLVVNFHEIGMSDIMQPRHLSVGYCYGECNDIHQYSSNHTAIKQRARWSSTLVNQHVLRQQLKPCCAPLVLKDIFIMTSDGDGTMIRKLLPKVIVESCGCV